MRVTTDPHVTGRINTLVHRKHKQILFVMYSQPHAILWSINLQRRVW